MATSTRWLLAVCCAAACAGSGKQGKKPGPNKHEVTPLAKDAAAGVTDQALKKLLVEHWDWRMRSAPVWATTLGDHRFDDKIGDNSEAAIAAAHVRQREFLTKARAIPAANLGAKDRLTVDLFIHTLDTQIARQVCKLEMWNVTAGSNAVVQFNRLPSQHKLKQLSDGNNLIARYHAIAQSIDNTIANLRRGAAVGMYANAETVRRAVKLIDDQLAKPLSTWALLEPLSKVPKKWTLVERQEFSRGLTKAVDASVRPAYTRYRDFLRDHILPKARDATQAGIIALPNGKECYAALIRYFTDLARTAAELHDIGKREIASINGEMTRLGTHLFSSADLAATLHKLRTSPELYYETEQQVIAGAEAALAAAKKAMTSYFGVLPQADCVVRAIPEYEAKFSTIAYYRQPHYDGSKPGEYYINTYKPKTRPRFEMRVLSYHEAIPGHHLQIAIAQERTELPAFRKFGGNTAYVEGWALYTERLADEMHLYPTDLDRMGMLSYDAWRASRLVVDTGIHALGWTRQQAEDYMMRHTALTEINIRNEVDRYISWPGQALGYKVGQLEIFALRAMAKKKMGKRFDLKAFHDRVLENGALNLPVLRKQIEAWAK